MKKKKILFACDLDNTLLHSHRVRREGDICAEVLDGKEQSFVTPLTYQLIKEIAILENVQLLPVTTRSSEQYKRIKWPDGCTPELALVCNGSVLLKNGEPDEEWLKRSNEETAPYVSELKRLLTRYNNYECFKTVRIVDGKFLFAYCIEKEKAVQTAEKCSEDTQMLTVELSGSKLYFFPPPSNKGSGVRRFAELYGADFIIAAGDSSIDCSMLDEADTALVPDSSMSELLSNKNTAVCGKDEMFSEFILKYVMSYAKHTSKSDID